jgi:hypothetical protein
MQLKKQERTAMDKHINQSRRIREGGEQATRKKARWGREEKGERLQTTTLVECQRKTAHIAAC